MDCIPDECPVAVWKIIITYKYEIETHERLMRVRQCFLHAEMIDEMKYAHWHSASYNLEFSFYCPVLQNINRFHETGEPMMCQDLATELTSIPVNQHPPLLDTPIHRYFKRPRPENS